MACRLASKPAYFLVVLWSFLETILKVGHRLEPWCNSGSRHIVLGETCACLFCCKGRSWPCCCLLLLLPILVHSFFSSRNVLSHVSDLIGTAHLKTGWAGAVFVFCWDLTSCSTAFSSLHAHTLLLFCLEGSLDKCSDPPVYTYICSVCRVSEWSKSLSLTVPGSAALKTDAGCRALESRFHRTLKMLQSFSRSVRIALKQTSLREMCRMKKKNKILALLWCDKAHWYLSWKCGCYFKVLSALCSQYL